MRSNGHEPDPARGPAEGVKSAERVLDVMELLTRECRGYLSLDEATRRYTLGIRVWEAGQAYNLHDDLVRQAVPVMEGIVDDLDEITQLAIRDGRYNVYLAKVDCRQPMQLISSVGRRQRGYATDNEEYTRGLRCVAVPVLGRDGETIAAISCSIPLARLDAAKFNRALSLLQTAVAEIGQRVSGRSPSASIPPGLSVNGASRR